MKLLSQRPSVNYGMNLNVDMLIFSHCNGNRITVTSDIRNTCVSHFVLSQTCAVEQLGNSAKLPIGAWVTL